MPLQVAIAMTNSQSLNTKLTTKVKWLLVQFAKAPVLGKVKTRLIPELGDEQACSLHWLMVEELCRRFSADKDSVPWDYQLHVDDTAHPAVIKLGTENDIDVREQAQGDLGQKMLSAIDEGLKSYERVAIIGSDCLFVDQRCVYRLFDELVNDDLSIVPALDGGYAAIAMSRLYTVLFNEMPWGTDQVFEKTIRTCKANGISVARLETVRDIDRIEDLRACAVHPLISAFIDSQQI